jgi:hypothetical protein
VAEPGLYGADAAVTATLYVEFGFDELLMDLSLAVIEEVEGAVGDQWRVAARWCCGDVASATGDRRSRRG